MFYIFRTATHVLDEVSVVCCYLINVLKIVNISRRPLPMTAVSSFVNLKVLYISPHNINDELVESFGKLNVEYCLLYRLSRARNFTEVNIIY